MSRPPPDHRGQVVLKAVQSSETYESTHTYETSLFNYLKRKDKGPPEIEEAFELYSNFDYRHVINAAILGRASNDLLSDALEMSPTTIPAYRHLFFDRNVFPHALAIHKFILALEIEENYKQYYVLANQKGAEALLKRFRIGKPLPLSPDEVLNHMLSDQYDRAIAHRGEQITSEIAMVSLQWGREAVKTASLIIQRGDSRPESGTNQMKVALRVTDQTRTAEEAGIGNEEIVTE